MQALSNLVSNELTLNDKISTTLNKKIYSYYMCILIDAFKQNYCDNPLQAITLDFILDDTIPADIISEIRNTVPITFTLSDNEILTYALAPSTIATHAINDLATILIKNGHTCNIEYSNIATNNDFTIVSIVSLSIYINTLAKL